MYVEEVFNVSFANSFLRLQRLQYIYNWYFLVSTLFYYYKLLKVDLNKSLKEREKTLQNMKTTNFLQTNILKLFFATFLASIASAASLEFEAYRMFQSEFINQN